MENEKELERLTPHGSDQKAIEMNPELKFSLLKAIEQKDSKSLPGLLDHHPDEGDQQLDLIAALGNLVLEIERSPFRESKRLTLVARISKILHNLRGSSLYSKDLKHFLRIYNSLEGNDPIKKQLKDLALEYSDCLQSFEKNYKVPWILIVCLPLAILTVLAVAIFLISYFSTTSFISCQHDPNVPFKDMVYFKDGIKETRIKYIIGDVTTFDNAKQKCEGMKAELWEVLDGEPEWTEMFKVLGPRDMSAWINGKIESCPPNETCSKSEAEKGFGLPMSRPHGKQRYSRLYGDENGNKCVAINEGLWLRKDCSYNGVPVCVLRGCVDTSSKR